MVVETKGEKAKRMHKFFKDLWDIQEDEQGSCYCYETGQELKGFIYRGNTCCYHHILPKNKYPEYAFEPWNIVILHPDVHTRVEGDLDKCSKVKLLTMKLKEKYG